MLSVVHHVSCTTALCCSLPLIYDRVCYRSEEEILVIGDPEQLYGDSWLLCYTLEAKETQLAALQAAIEVREGRGSLCDALGPCGGMA